MASRQIELLYDQNRFDSENGLEPLNPLLC